MGGYVSVNADRLRDLALALKDAASLIPDRKQTISSAINGWDGEWNAAKVEQLATFLENNWREMEDRADLARTAQHQPVVTSPGDPMASWRSIPWDVTPEVLAQEGLQDARNIASDLNSDDEDAQERARSELAWAMKAHADDAAWLEAFFANGGSEVVNTANIQHLEADIPLDETAQDHLGYYADGVAAASLLAEGGEIDLPDGTFDVFHEGDNVVSTGIMMKFGPTGDQYGSEFLTDAGQAALDWRENNDENRASYSAPDMNSAGYVPGGYVHEDNAWFQKLGVDIFYTHTNGEDAANGIDLIREYDPSTNILNIVGDNQAASQGLLTGDRGEENARSLVDYQWQTPGPVALDDSGPAAKIITAATQDRIGPEAEASAQAASNVFQASSDLYDERGDRSDYDKSQYPEVPVQLARALSQMGSTYVLDMANSTERTDSDQNEVVRDADGNYVIQMNASIVNGFMGTMMTDPQAAGSYQGSVDSLLQTAAAAKVQFPEDATNLLERAGYLKGMTEIALSTQDFDEAQALDAANKREQTYVDAATGIVGSLPLGDLPGFLFGAADAIRGAAGDSLFPQDAADTYTSEAQFALNQGQDDMRVFVAQGYADAGAFEPPADASFVHGGVISPRNDSEQAAFDNWWANMPVSLADQNDAPAGYQAAAGEYAPDDDKFSDPK